MKDGAMSTSPMKDERGNAQGVAHFLILLVVIGAIKNITLVIRQCGLKIPIAHPFYKVNIKVSTVVLTRKIFFSRTVARGARKRRAYLRQARRWKWRCCLWRLVSQRLWG